MQQNFKGANFNIYFVHRAGYEVVNLAANKEKVQLILFQHCIASYRKNRASISSPSHCLSNQNQTSHTYARIRYLQIQILHQIVRINKKMTSV